MRQIQAIIAQKSERIIRMATPTIIVDYVRHLAAAGKSPLTCKNYHSDLLGFANWFAEKNQEPMTLLKITPTDTRQYKRALLAMKLKPQTINRRIVALNQFLNWAWEARNVKHRFTLLKTIKLITTAPRWLNKSEQHLLRRLVEQTQKVRDIAIITLLLNTGLRLHELCVLTWTDVELSERKGLLTVHTGKGGKYRQIPLNKDARMVLLKHQAQQPIKKESPIFIGQRGTLTVRGVQLLLKRLVKNTALATVSAHQLRHTFCKNLIDAEVGLEKVAMLAGHESLDTTKLYCKPSLQDLSQAVERIGEQE